LKLFKSIQKLGFFSQVTIVPLPPPFMGRKSLRLDDVLAFIDDGVLVMSAMDAGTKAKIISEIYKRERKEVNEGKRWDIWLLFWVKLSSGNSHLNLSNIWE
jgi:hypothetical protein